MEHTDGQSKAYTLSSPVRVLIALVAITSVVSLFYAVQYYIGGPVQLSVVSEFYDVAFSPRGDWVAAGARDGRVHVWQISRSLGSSAPREFDVDKEEPWPRRTLSGHEAPIIKVAFDRRGRQLTSVSSDGQVRNWILADLPEAGETSERSDTVLELAGGALLGVDLSADRSRLAAIGEDGVVRIWDLETGEEIQSVGSGENSGRAVALNTEGTLVAAGYGEGVLVWEVESGEVVRRLEGYCEDETLTTRKACDEADEDWLGHEKEVSALAFDPNDEILASGSADTTIVFWELESGEVKGAAEGHWATVTSMVFAEDGRTLLSGGKDTAIKNLRVPGGKSIATYQGHLNTVNGAVYGSSSDTIVSVADDGTLRVWQTANQQMTHIEWSRYGFQPIWGGTFGAWMLISGLLGLVCVWGLRRRYIWSQLFTLGLYILGPIVMLGLPLLEMLSYPLTTAIKLQVAWPLIVLAVWYIVLLVVLTWEKVAIVYEAPEDATLSEQLVISQRTLKTRLGIYSLAVWVGLLVILYSVLRRFNLDIAFMTHFFPFIMGGAGLTLLVSAASIALAIVLALLGALGRLSNNPIANGISSFYISLVRGTPLLVQIFIWYLGLPQLDIILRPIMAGVLALGVNYGAYMTEIFRAGIQAIGKGQHEAAQALGMSRVQTLRRIVLPQAFRIVIPPIGNEFIAMMKDSSLVYVMGVWELTFRAQKIGRQNFRTMETFLIAAGFYWILTVVFQFLQGKLEEYMARSERR